MPGAAHRKAAIVSRLRPPWETAIRQSVSKPAVPVAISLDSTRWVTTPAARSCCTGTARAAYEAPMPVKRGRAAASGAGAPSSARSRPGAAGPDSPITRRQSR